MNYLSKLPVLGVLYVGSLVGSQLLAVNPSMVSTKSPITQMREAEIIITDWKMIEESPTMIDVSYRIVKCSESASAELQLSIFNENTYDQTASFDLTLTDSQSGTSHVVAVDVPVSLATVLTPSCSSDELGALKINIPEGMQAENVTVEITFR